MLHYNKASNTRITKHSGPFA